MNSDSNDENCSSDDLSCHSDYSESSSSSDEKAADDQDITEEVDESEEDSGEPESTIPTKRARTRGGFAPRGVKTRGGFAPRGAKTRGGSSSASRQQQDLDNGVHDYRAATNDQGKTQGVLTKAEQKKLKKAQDQALWKDEPNKVQKFSFKEKTGLKINLQNNGELDFYKLLLTDDLIDLMVLETNLYAAQEIERNRPLRRNS